MWNHPTLKGRVFLAWLCDGLGPRLRTLIASSKLAKESNRRLVIRWEQDCRMPAGYHDLFDLELPEYNGPVRDLVPAAYDLNRICRDPLGCRRILLSDAPLVSMSMVFPRVTYMPGEFRRLFFEFQPRRELSAQASGFAQHCDLSKQVGVHVRSRESVRGRKHWVANVVDFFPVLDAMESVPFLLVTDDSEANEAMLSRYNGRITSWLFGIKVDEERTVESARQALVSILLLSRTQQVVGTAASSLNQVAAWVGGGRRIPVGPWPYEAYPWLRHM